MIVYILRMANGFFKLDKGIINSIRKHTKITGNDYVSYRVLLESIVRAYQRMLENSKA